MPVYNAEKYLKYSIESILNQTYTNFEFLIIDDASTDKSSEIIHNYSDKRIQYFKNEKNLKIAKTLNKGLKLCKGEYIARMDADDISLPERLTIQVKYMNKNPLIGVSGASINYFNKNNDSLKVWELITIPKKLKVNLLNFSVIPHPSSIFRRELIENYRLLYKENNAEDYDLWVKFSRVTKLGNINKVLLNYRVHEESITSAQLLSRIEGHKLVVKDQLEFLLEEPLKENWDLFFLKQERIDLIYGIKILVKILRKNYQKKLYDNKELLIFILSKLIAVFLSKKRETNPIKRETV